MRNNDSEKTPFMEKFATFIVEKRNLFIFIYVALFIFSIISSSWVKVCDDLSAYLPENSDTKRGLSVMENFKSYSSARVMVININYDEAEEIKKKIENLDFVNTVSFEDSEDNYKDSCALFDVILTSEDKNEQEATLTFDKLEDALKEYDTYITRSYEDTSKSLAKEVSVVLLVASIIILLFLVLTSSSYMEVPVLILTFVMAAVINKGTNFLFGEISFVSNSVTIVLQLALSIDYAIMFSHRYSEEREKHDVETAVIKALSKSVSAITASSLTTVSGLMALMFMEYKIGFDLGMVLIKAIILSLLSVFTFMPCLLVYMGKYIDKTKHRSFIPDVSFLGKTAHKLRKIVPPVFLAVIIAACIISSRCNYVYGISTLSPDRKDSGRIATEMINSEFDEKNPVAVMVNRGDYRTEKLLIKDLENIENVKSVTGIANIEAKNGYFLGDSVTPSEFSTLSEIEIEKADMIYSLYAVENSDYAKIIAGLGKYEIPLVDLFSFIYDKKKEGIIELDKETEDSIDDLYKDLSVAKEQLISDDYSRILVYTDLPEEGKEAFELLENIKSETEKYYKECYMAGKTTSDYDLRHSFKKDNILVNLLSILFVLIVLFFTFKSAGTPILLIAVIQGSIWLNFTVPTVLGNRIFFLSYLIVSAIQMGANIDYAIVISERYLSLKKELPLKDAMTKTIQLAFPTILTSGSILACSGLLISKISTNAIIASMGNCLFRGTLISMILVLGVLPEILMIGDFVIEKTSFSIKRAESISVGSGVYVLNGRVRGVLNGFVDADIKGIVKGDIKAKVDIENIKKEGEINEFEE